MNWIDDVRWFLWVCWTWVRVRLRPDKRPSEVIMAEVRTKLSEMPAGKEIHEVFEHLDAFDAAEEKKAKREYMEER